MSSHKQVEANRRNALKSTGPATPEGKERSRCNAVRHGLTAETIIGTLEDEADYQAFEAAIIADYDAESAVERELVLRLASVLWRLRRATGIESALFEFATTDDCKHKQLTSPEIAPDIPDHSEREHLFPATPQPDAPASQEPSFDSSKDIAASFLHLAEASTFPLDRLSRYEHLLWRQARQLVATLDTLRCGKHRSSPLRFPFSLRAGMAKRP